MALPFTLAACVDAITGAIRAAPARASGGVDWVSSPEFGKLVTIAGAFVVMGFSLLMTRSRSGLAAFAIGALIVAAMVARRQPTRAGKAAVAAAVLLLVVGTGAWGGIDLMTSKFFESRGENSLRTRISAWTDTVTIVRDFRVFGSGLDTYGIAMMQYQTNRQLPHFNEAHNDYLQIAAEGGLLVGVPALFTLVVFVRDVRRRFREAPRDGTTYWLRVGAVVGLVSIALQSLFEFSLQMPGNAILFALLAALALHQSPNLVSTRSRSVRLQPDPLALP